MSMRIGDNLSQNVLGGQRATPTFAHNKTWNSIDEMNTAWSNLAKDWRNHYAGAFAGAGAGGRGQITQDELNGLLQAEFGGMGVNFTDSAVDETKPKAGTFEVYIDEGTRRKMADDPEYRAKVMAVIQVEMAGAKGYSVQTAAGAHTDRTTGLSMNMIEGGPLYEGVPHSAGGTSASGGVVAFSTGSADGKGKSLIEQLLEKLEEKRAEKLEAERKEAAKETREDRVEISLEARAAQADRLGNETDETKKPPTAAGEPKTPGDRLNLLV